MPHKKRNFSNKNPSSIMTQQQSSNQVLARYLPPAERTPQLQQYLAGALAQNDQAKIQKFVEWATANYPQWSQGGAIIYIDSSTHIDASTKHYHGDYVTGNQTTISGNDFSTKTDIDYTHTEDYDYQDYDYANAEVNANLTGTGEWDFFSFVGALGIIAGLLFGMKLSLVRTYQPPVPASPALSQEAYE